MFLRITWGLVSQAGRCLWPQRAAGHGPQEAVEGPYLDPIRCLQSAIAQVDEDATRKTPEIGDGAQASELLRREARLRLDLEREVFSATAQ